MDKHVTQRGRTRRTLLRMFQRELGDALRATLAHRRPLENSTKATSADTFSGVKSALFGTKSRLPRAATSAITIMVALALIVFVTARYGHDCRSPQRSISIGNAVLVAGCLQKSSPSWIGP